MLSGVFFIVMLSVIRLNVVMVGVMALKVKLWYFLQKVKLCNNLKLKKNLVLLDLGREDETANFIKISLIIGSV